MNVLPRASALKVVHEPDVLIVSLHTLGGLRALRDENQLRSSLMRGRRGARGSKAHTRISTDALVAVTAPVS